MDDAVTYNAVPASIGVAGPAITGVATATVFTTTYGTVSTAQTFPVGGTNLIADITATAPAGFEVSNDGTNYGATATFTPVSGTVNGGSLGVRLKTSATVAGTYNSQNIVLSSTGATSVNITTSASGNSVAAKGLTITGLVGSNKFYDGTTDATVTGTPVYSGLANSDSFSVIGTPVASFATAAAATGKTITVTGYSAPSGNYSLTQPSLTANIDPKALTVTASNVTKSQGATLTGGAGSTDFTSSGLISPQTIGSVTIAYGAGAASGDPAGFYSSSVTPSAATGGSFTASNYSISYVAGDLTVTASPTITTSGTLSAVNTTYGTASTSPTSFTVSGGFLTGDLTVAAPSSAFEISTSLGSGYGSSLTLPAPGGSIATTTVYVRLAASTAAGTYSGNITVSGGGATTMNVATASSTVAVKPLTISGLTAASKEYDGTTTVSVSGTPAYSGLENGESFTVADSVTWAFGDKTVNTAKVLTRTGSFTAPSPNYSITQPTLSANITAKELTVTGAAVTSKTYNGTTSATITGTLTGAVINDVVTLSGGGTYASANAGTGIAVTPNLSLTGADAVNYTLTQPAGLTGDITKADQTITFGALAVKNTEDVPFGLTGSATSTLAVTFTSSNNAVATVSGLTATITGAGSTTITASQAGDGNYNAAPPVNQTLVVNLAKTLVAGWDFQTTSTGGTAAVAAPNSPSSYAANFGTGTIYLDGTNGSSSWITATAGNEVTSFGGTGSVNTGPGFSTSTTGASSLAIVGGTSTSANTKKIVLKFSMLNRANLDVSYASQGTATGFSSQTWDYSADGTNWTAAGTITPITTSFALKTLATITSLDRAPTAYLRMTVTGATSATGNNRFDNFQIRVNDLPVPTISTAGTLVAVDTTYGVPSASPASFTLSGVDMGAGITVSPPSGFEVSISASSGYASSISVGASGTISSTPVYVRLAATTAVGSYSGPITLSSLGAVNKTVATVLSTVSKATPVVAVAPTASAITYGQTLVSSSLTGGAASVAGIFTFTTPGTAPNAGTANQSVTFTPTDTANYNTATTSVSVVVNAATLASGDITISQTNGVYSASSPGVSGFSLSYSGRSGTSYGPSATAPTAAGLYTVVATSSDPNYTGSNSESYFVAGAIAANDNVSRTANSSSFKIPISTLLGNDSQVDASGTLLQTGLTIASLTAGTGNSVSISGAFVFYTPADRTAGAPLTFSYTVSNGTATTAIGTVTVTTVAPAEFTLGMIRVVTPAAFAAGETTITVEFAGVINQTYQIEYSTDLANWSPPVAAPTGQTGTFNVTFTAPGDVAAAWNGSLFFRATR